MPRPDPTHLRRSVQRPLRRPVGRLRFAAALTAAAAILLAGAVSALGAPAAAPRFTVTTAAAKAAFTNDRRPVAGGVYDTTANTTFVSWSGANMDNYVQSVTAAGVWSAPKLIGRGDGDPHNYPTMVEADNGHLLVFRGLHNTELDVAVSPQAHSTAGTWTEHSIAVAPAATYPMPVKADNGDIYVFYRQTDQTIDAGAPTDERPMEYVRSSDDGATWTSSKTIAGVPYVIGSTDRTDHMNEIYVGQIRHEENPERFTFVWTLAGGGPSQHTHDRFHKNLYSATFTPSDHHFHSAAGKDLGVSVTGSTLASALVVDTGNPVDKTPGYFQLTGTFADKTPTVVYSMSDGEHAGHWTGTSWKTAKLSSAYALDMEPASATTFRIYTASGSTVTTYLLSETPSWTRETSFSAPGSVNHGVIIGGYRDPYRLLLEGPTGGGIYVAGGH